jgi:hypothetical protein
MTFKNFISGNVLLVNLLTARDNSMQVAKHHMAKAGLLEL